METTTAMGPREITDAEVAHYEEHGWAKIEGFITPELAASLLAGAQELMGAEPQGETTFSRSSTETAKRGGEVVDAVFWQDYHFAARDDKLEPFQSLAFSKEIGRAAQRFMQLEVPVRFTSDLIACKMPSGRPGGAPTAWHQDIVQFPLDRFGSLAFWVSLRDLTPEHGTMRFYCGSQRSGLLGRLHVTGETLPDRYPQLGTRFPLSEPISLKAGDATVHHGAVVHGAPENTTADPRWGYIMAYVPGDTLYTGASNHNYDGLGLKVNEPLDHPRFPIVYP